MKHDDNQQLQFEECHRNDFGTFLLLEPLFKEMWDKKFEHNVDQSFSCKQCMRYGEQCYIHEKEARRLRAKYNRDRWNHIIAYGSSACGHYYPEFWRGVIHNFTCPSLRDVRERNKSCVKCEFFFTHRTVYLQAFQWYIGNWACIKCGYFLDYKAKGLV